MSDDGNKLIYEFKHDTGNRAIFTLIIVCLLGLIISIVSTYGVFTLVRDSEIDRKILSINPVDTQELRKMEDAALNSYTKKMDGDKTVISIPVERAMEIIAEESK